MTDKVLRIVRDACAVEGEKVSPETKLKEISLDSISFISALVALEEEFQIEFDDEELNIYDWDCVQNIIDLTEKKINEKKGLAGAATV